MAERLRLIVPEDLAGERLDRVVAVMGRMSRADARSLVDGGDVLVDGVPTAPKVRVTAGQTLEFPDAPPAPVLEPEPVEFAVVYEDEHLVVVDKPAGVVVHPGAGRREGSLVAGVLHRYPQVEGVGEPGRWGIVHRLDRDTSGLMVVALTADAHRLLSEMIARRQMERTYLALVDGVMPVPTGTIDAPIARDPSRPTRRRVDPAGRPARTHYTVREVFEDAGLTLLEVRLETGRTHQIRVHFAAIDHPLAGDPVYRPGPDRIAVPRVFLHASRLSFTHPATGESATFESPLPSELTEVLDRLG